MQSRRTCTVQPAFPSPQKLMIITATTVKTNLPNELSSANVGELIMMIQSRLGTHLQSICASSIYAKSRRHILNNIYAVTQNNTYELHL